MHPLASAAPDEANAIAATQADMAIHFMADLQQGVWRTNCHPAASVPGRQRYCAAAQLTNPAAGALEGARKLLGRRRATAGNPDLVRRFLHEVVLGKPGLEAVADQPSAAGAEFQAPDG
jgi:hypothetical protein